MKLKIFTSFFLITSLFTTFLFADQIPIDEINSKHQNEIAGGITILDKITARADNPEKFFAHENRQAGKKVGLALSGGGIRSNAFSLGVLSALHEAKLLQKIDYISSVSGGSWANAAYQSWPESDKVFFDCLNLALKNNEALPNNCGSIRDVFRTSQIEIITIKQWQKAIVKHHLHGQGDDPQGITMKRFGEVSQQHNRPYPIFYASHLVGNCQQRTRYYGKKTGFEFTPHQFGAIKTCRKASGISINIAGPGYFLNHQLVPLDFKYKNLSISRKSNSFMASDAIHASSGVYRPLVALKTRIRYDSKEIESIPRPSIFDGGKSDNYGLLPLAERKTDLIIISDDSLNPDTSLKGIAGAGKQLQKLLGQPLDLKCNGQKANKCFNPKKRLKVVSMACRPTVDRKTCSDIPVYILKPTTLQVGKDAGSKSTLFFKYLKENAPNHAAIIKEIKRSNEDAKKGAKYVKDSWNTAAATTTVSGVPDWVVKAALKKAGTFFGGQVEKYMEFPNTFTFVPFFKLELIQAHFYMGKYLVEMEKQPLSDAIEKL